MGKNRPQKHVDTYRHSSSVKPSYADAGLSSKLNRDSAKRILDRSSPDEIASLLRTVRYVPPVNEGAMAKAALTKKLDAEVAAYLKSNIGQQRVKVLCEQAMDKAVKDWFSTNEAQLKAKESKLRILSSKVADDKDVLEKACRDAIDREVSRYLSSPQGQDAIEQERKRRVQQLAVKKTDSPQMTSWIDDTLEKLKNGKQDNKS